MKIRTQLNELGKLATKSAESGDAYASLCTQFSVITDLMDQSLSQPEWDLVHKLYLVVSKDIEAILKQEIAAELLASDEAPDKLVWSLCNEEIDISGELLRETTKLADKDLADLVKRKGAEHRVVIASREDVSESVSEAIVESAEVAAINRLLVNDTAKISDGSFQKIAALCSSAQDLHEPLVHRHDVPWTAVESIINIVSRQLVDVISKKWKIPHSKLAKIAMRAAGRTSDTMAERRRMRIRSDMRPNDDRGFEQERRSAIRIISSLQAGDREATVKLLQDWTGLPVKAAATILEQKDLRLMATLYKAMATEQLTFSRTVVALLGQKNGVPENELYKAVEFFISLDEEEARQRLEHWRQNPELLN